MPKTKLGKWSLGLIIAMPILLVVGASFTSSLYSGVPAGNSIMEDVTERPALALAMLTGMACGILSFIAGLVAIFKQKERNFLVYAATAIGALLLLFLAGEVVSPH